MSGNISPVSSPKGTEAGLHAEKKEPIKAVVFKPAVDTSDIKAEEASGGFLSCLQDLACSIWDLGARFFNWIGSLFAPAPRHKPELLANPTKHIAAKLAVWKDPDGAMKQLLDAVSKYSKDPTAEFSWHFSARKNASSYYESIFSCGKGSTSHNIAALQEPAARKQFTEQLMSQLAELDTNLKKDKLYIDLDIEDEAWITLSAQLATPVPFYANHTINHFSISQTFSKENPDSEPYLGRSLVTRSKIKE